jgi:hypothetical protein
MGPLAGKLVQEGPRNGPYLARIRPTQTYELAASVGKSDRPFRLGIRPYHGFIQSQFIKNRNKNLRFGLFAVLGSVSLNEIRACRLRVEGCI